MHELSLAQSLLAIVEEEARRHGVDRVATITVRVGRLSHLAPESLRFCFEVLKRDTLAAGADLVIHQIPLCQRCPACGRQFTPPDPLPACPACGHLGLDLVSGQELAVESLGVAEES